MNVAAERRLARGDGEEMDERRKWMDEVCVIGSIGVSLSAARRSSREVFEEFRGIDGRRER